MTQFCNTVLSGFIRNNTEDMEESFQVTEDVACGFDLRSQSASSVAEVSLQDNGPVTTDHEDGT